ncbi:hypothetical protein ABT349_24950, partial [Streptomyces microflavus]
STSMQSWGAVLLIAACALWVRLAFLLVDHGFPWPPRPVPPHRQRGENGAAGLAVRQGQPR